MDSDTLLSLARLAAFRGNAPFLRTVMDDPYSRSLLEEHVDPGELLVYRSLSEQETASSFKNVHQGRNASTDCLPTLRQRSSSLRSTRSRSRSSSSMSRSRLRPHTSNAMMGSTFSSSLHSAEDILEMIHLTALSPDVYRRRHLPRKPPLPSEARDPLAAAKTSVRLHTAYRRKRDTDKKDAWFLEEESSSSNLITRPNSCPSWTRRIQKDVDVNGLSPNRGRSPTTKCATRSSNFSTTVSLSPSKNSAILLSQFPAAHSLQPGKKLPSLLGENNSRKALTESSPSSLPSVPAFAPPLIRDEIDALRETYELLDKIDDDFKDIDAECLFLSHFTCSICPLPNCMRLSAC